MISKEIKVRALRQQIGIGADRINLHIYEIVYNSTLKKAEATYGHFNFDENLEDGQDFPRLPSLRIDVDLAQQFMDELWNCGIRPAEGAGSAGAMAAVKAHLEDMRALVFRKEG